MANKLVFIPGPGMGHLLPAVEFGKLLTSRDQRISILYLIINLPLTCSKTPDVFPSNLIGTNSQLSFIQIPSPILSDNQEEEEEAGAKKVQNPNVKAVGLIDLYKSKVKDTIFKIMKSGQVLTGLIVDMFTINMIDVGNELGLFSYTFYTSTAAFLGLVLYVQVLKDEKDEDITIYKDTNAELSVPCFVNPVLAKVLPTTMLDKNGGSESVFNVARKIRKTKGIILNSFLELENHAIRTLLELDQEKTIMPRIYPIGPIINTNSESYDGQILSWLNDQPFCSVVFLCFGSFGGFKKEQVEEIAKALELCGCRFLWSLRRPRQTVVKDDIGGEYEKLDEILPKGFLERTSRIGKVIGWAPQVAILSHPSVGAFVSHCGWNSILESLWFGVPIAAWPIYAEQQVNAFEMVVELGLAVEIRMDYRNEGNTESNFIVSAEEIQRSIQKIMEEKEKNEVRKKVKEMKDRCQKTVRKEEGSSYMFLGQLIEDLMSITPKML